MGKNNDVEQYSPLAKAEPYRDSEELTEVDDALHHPIRSSHRHGLLLVVAAAILIVISTAQLILTISLRLKPPTTPTRLISKDYGSPCGTSSAEAETNGCHWDYGLTSWIPDECYNSVLDAEFLSLNIPFEIYWDKGDDEGPDLTHPYKDMKELMDNPGLNWMKRPYHAPHCMHTWKYMHFAWLNGTGIPRSIVQYSHTAHCTRAMMHHEGDDTEWIGIAGTVESRFSRCIGREELYNGEMKS